MKTRHRPLLREHSPRQTREDWGPGDSAPFRQFLFLMKWYQERPNWKLGIC